MGDFDEIKARHEAATRGPWRWFGYKQGQQIYLATVGRGRIYVMDFVRWGMRQAKPRFNHPQLGGRYSLMTGADEIADSVKYAPYEILGINNPDAKAIEQSWSDIDWLIGEVERLRNEVAERQTAVEIIAP